MAFSDPLFVRLRDAAARRLRRTLSASESSQVVIRPVRFAETARQKEPVRTPGTSRATRSRGPRIGPAGRARLLGREDDLRRRERHRSPSSKAVQPAAPVRPRRPAVIGRWFSLR